MTSYRVYVTSVIDNPSSLKSQEAYHYVAFLTCLEALLGIISACLPLLKPVAYKVWHTLPKDVREKVTAITTAAGSIVASASHFLSKPSFSHGPRSFIWFSTSSGSSESQKSIHGRDSGLRATCGKDEVQETKTGQMYVHREFDVESAVSDI